MLRRIRSKTWHRPIHKPTESPRKSLWRASLLLVLLSHIGGLSWAQSRIAVPSYQDPGSGQWNAWRSLGASSLGIMIVNLNNGDDTRYHATVDQAIRNTRKKGIFVVGYVYTGYGRRDPATVRKKVDGVFRNYLVDGIFFDEVPTDCSAVNSYSGTTYLYYQDLANYVRRNQVGGRIVILNPGTQPNNDCWMSITNILVTAESNGLDDYRQTYQEKSWFHRYPPERFWHIVYSVPSVASLSDVMALSRDRGAGWVYVTDQDGGNPYGQPPAYWSLEGAEVTGQGVQALYASFRPKSSDENGNPVPARVAFRWRAVNGTKWQIFLDTDQNAGTGYGGPGSGLKIGADYMLQAGADGSASLFRYTGSGSNWDWTEIKTHTDILFLDAGVNLIETDVNELGKSGALDYQIRSVDAVGKTLFTSYVAPFSLNDTAYVFELQDHGQD